MKYYLYVIYVTYMMKIANMVEVQNFEVLVDISNFMKICNTKNYA
jgi:hypothetical protein